MNGRRIDYLPLDDVKPATRNPKRHDGPAINASITKFGMAETPLLDERTGRLVAGHGRIAQLEAMRDAGQQPPDGVQVDSDGRWLVPITRGWSSRSDAEAEAYLLASNKLTSNGGWDDAELGELLASLADQDPDLIGLAGFDEAEMEALLAESSVAELEPVLPPDDGPSAPPAEPVTKPGDVWLLGPHRIICGDCRDFSTVERLLDGRSVNVAFTSPPYASQRKYDESSGFRPIPPDEYVDWFEEVQANVRAVLAEDGSWFVNIKPASDGLDTETYVLDLVLAHVRRWGWHFATEFCWERNGTPGMPGRRFKNQFEPIFQFSLADWKFRPDAVRHPSDHVPVYDVSTAKGPVSARRANTSTAGMADMQGTGADVGAATVVGLAYPGNRLPTLSGSHEATGHAAAFPVGLPTFFIRAYSDEGDVIFDPFMGSGSTLVAAHGEGRVACGSEISPAYTDVICRRFQEHTDITPILESTGKPHDFTGGD